MKVGVPTEIKEQESRVSLTPLSVKELTKCGHEVIIQDNAGFGAGFENSEYEQVGAKIAPTASDVFNDADMIVKVKEPLREEVSMFMFPGSNKPLTVITFPVMFAFITFTNYKALTIL